MIKNNPFDEIDEDELKELVHLGSWTSNYIGTIKYGLELITRRVDIDEDVKKRAKKATNDLPKEKP